MIPAYPTLSNLVSESDVIAAFPARGITGTHHRGQLLQMAGEGEISTWRLMSKRNNIIASIYTYREKIQNLMALSLFSGL